jgi:hypothetical protein
VLPDKVRAALIPCDRLVGIQAVNGEIGLRGLKIQVSDKNTFHAISLAGYWVRNLDKRNCITTNLREKCGRDWNAKGGAAYAPRILPATAEVAVDRIAPRVRLDSAFR